MTRQQEIAESMRAVRASGTATANRLPAAIDRARDWREYVRSYPMQSVAAASLLGFLVIPTKKQSYPVNTVRAEELEPKRTRSLLGFLGALAAPVRPWAVSAATDLAKRAVMRQIAGFTHSNSTHTDKHDRRQNAFQGSGPAPYGYPVDDAHRHEGAGGPGSAGFGATYRSDSR
jgi:hypothetical protein